MQQLLEPLLQQACKYDIREIDEELYMAVLAARKQSQQGG